VLILDRDEIRVDPAKVYQTAGLRNFGRGLFARPVIDGAISSYSRLYRLHHGQVVFSRLFGWEGAVALVPTEFDGWFVSPEFPTFTLDSARIDTAYLGHVLRSQRFQEALAGATRGLGQRRQRVHVEDFISIQIPLPTPSEQRQIGAVLDSIDAAARQAINAFSGSVTSLHELLPAVVDSLTDAVAVGQASVEELARFVSDTVHPGEDPAPARVFVGLQHVESHTGQCLGSDPLGAMKGRKFRFRPGDVVYGYLRPYLNKVWLADRHGLCSVDQYVLRPRDRVDGALLAHQLRGRRVLTEAVDLTHNLQLPRIRSALLGRIELPLVPPKDVQMLVQRLDVARDRVVQARELRSRQLKLTGALVPSAMNEAFGALS